MPKGNIGFPAVAPGDYLVRAELRGFAPFSRALRVSGRAATLQLPIALVPTAAAGRTENSEPSAPVMRSPEGDRSRMPSAAPADAAENRAAGRAGAGGASEAMSAALPPSHWPLAAAPDGPGGERYAHVEPNRFHSTRAQPLSTFGADVDTASYANVRRFLSSGQLPPRDAVRIEELINYFRYDYGAPAGNSPIALTTEIGDCPWAPSHKLVLIGARARTPDPREIEGRNIVLLLDVSGSMAPADRLPMIKTALGMFVDTLEPDDRLAIVTYAGSSGLALPSTPARRRDVIQRAIARHRPGSK